MICAALLQHENVPMQQTVSFTPNCNAAGFGRKREKKGFFEWYFNSRTPKERTMARTTPMRIEPKTFFANERTFLSWLHMAVTIGSIAAALLGFAGIADSTKKLKPQVCSDVFIPVLC